MKEIAKLYLSKVKISIQQVYYEKSENANHRIGDDIHNIDIWPKKPLYPECSGTSINQ